MGRVASHERARPGLVHFVAIVWSTIVGVAMFGALSTLRTPARAEAARPPRVLPCQGEFEEHPLGTPSGFVGDPPVSNTARFTTTGEPFLITYRSDWHEGGFLDIGSPERRARVDLGDAASPPVFDEQSYGPQNSEYEQRIDLDRYVDADAAPGDYWILISGGADMTLYTCVPGSISAVEPAVD